MPFYRCVPPSSGGGGGGNDAGVISVNYNGDIITPFIYNISGAGVDNASSNMFSRANFNYPITIGNKIASVDSLLTACTNFNSSITFDDNSVVKYLSAFLYSCHNFNQPINFPINAGIFNVAQLFVNCHIFNQNLNIQFGAIGQAHNAYAMLQGCENFNSRVNFRIKNNSVVGCSYQMTFDGCTSFNQPVIFKRAASMALALRNCTSFDQPIVVDCCTNNKFAVSSLNTFFGAKRSLDRKIIINNHYVNYKFNRMNVGDNTTIYVSSFANFVSNSCYGLVTGSDLSNNASNWTAVTNGYKHKSYNVYIYQNVSDGLNWFNNYYYNFYGEYPVYSPDNPD